MSRTSHFTARTQLGTAEDDILMAGRGKGERLYGGAGDDLLVSVDGGDYAHGGSGADIFAFRFNKNIRRSAKRGKTVDHVIEDFNLDEGDKICLSHLVTKSRHQNIDYRGSGRIKGTGIEVRLVQGKQGAAKKETEAFSGIEDGVSQTLGELPEISKTRRNGADSRLEVYEDGILLSNITLKNNPGSKSFSRKLGNAIFGKYSQTTKEVTSAEGLTENHLTSHSLSALGIPLKGNAAKMDFGSGDPEALMIQSINPAGESNLPFSNEIGKKNDSSSDDLQSKINFHGSLKTSGSEPLKVYGNASKPAGKNDSWPSYRFKLDMDLTVGIRPRFTLRTGGVVGIGSIKMSIPNLTASANYGILQGSISPSVSISGNSHVSADGINKTFTTGADVQATATFNMSHEGWFEHPISKSGSWKLEKNVASSRKSDDLTGVEWGIVFSPSLDFKVALGISETIKDVGSFQASIFKNGPSFTYPLALHLSDDKSYFSYGAAQIDWNVVLASVSVSTPVLTRSLSAGKFNLADLIIDEEHRMDINW